VRRRVPLLLAVAALTGAVLTACGHAAPGSAPSASATPAALRGTITVDAAASLNGVFPALARSFEREHPGATVAFSFGGSSALAASIVSGAPVDVFAAASTKTMRTVQDASLTATAPVVVARNRLEIAVPPGNPGEVVGLADFADPRRTIVVCDQAVPCGSAAQQVFGLAGVAAKPDSYEPDVTSVLTKVEGDEADAGLVYATDVRAAGSRVEGIPFPEAGQALTDYPVAVLQGSKQAALARAWVAYVQAHERDLQAAGFLAP
jgi:molybdate transport system substrate-binding protein